MPRYKAALIGLVCAILAFSFPAKAAVTFDAAALSTFCTAGTSCTKTPITVANNANRVLVVAIVFDSTAGTVSGVSGTWNSVSLGTALGHIGNSNAGDIYFFCLTNPGTGTNNLAASWTGTSGAWFVALSVYNADQSGGTTTCHDFTTNTSDGSVTPAVTVNNVVSGEIVFAAYTTGASFTTTGSGTTDIGKDNSSGSVTDVAGNYATGASGGVIMAYGATVAGGSHEAAAGVAIKELGAAVPARPASMLLLGAGR